MTDADRERAWEVHLADEPPLAPRPDFARRVMRRVLAEAEPHEPLAFPWRTLLTRVGAVAAIAAGGVAYAFSSPLPPVGIEELSGDWARAAWIALALGASLATLAASLASIGSTSEGW